MSHYHGHVSAPAIKACGRCGQQRIDVRKRSTFGLGGDGRLLCPSCVQAEHEAQGEAVKLFEPAPNQMPGQLSF